MKTRSFFVGALVLAAAAALNKIMGFIFQVAVYRLIGAEGVGLFNLVYPVYVLILVITTAGIPLAVSKLVAENLARGDIRATKKILRVALLLVFVSGIFFTTLTMLLLPFLTEHIFYDSRVALCFKPMIPGILIVSLSSVIRGYFQGLHDMTPTAIAQVVEQMVRISSGLLLANYLLPLGVAKAAAGIAAGGIIGEFFGFLVLLATYLSRRKKKTLPLGSYIRTKSILKSFFQLCGPITVGRIIATLLTSIDAFLIPRRLALSGITALEATKLYGQFTAVALTLLSIPTLITIALATALVPAIADAEAKNNRRLLYARSGDAIRITILAALPFTLYFLIFAGEFTHYIFKAGEVAPILQILALGGPFLYLIQTTTGILQGMGKPMIPVINMIYGAIAKLIGLWLLTATPGFSVYGTAISFVGFFIIVAILNILSVKNHSNLSIQLGPFLIKSLTSLALTAFTVFLIQWFFNTNGLMPLNIWLFTMFIGFGIYAILLFTTGLITRQDLLRFSFLRRFIEL